MFKEMKYCHTHHLEYHIQCPKCTTVAGLLEITEPVKADAVEMGYTGIPNRVLDRIKARADICYVGKKEDQYGVIRRSGFQDGSIDMYLEMKGDKKAGAFAFEIWQRQNGVSVMEVKKDEWVYTMKKKSLPGVRIIIPEFHNFTLEELYAFYQSSTENQ